MLYVYIWLDIFRFEIPGGGGRRGRGRKSNDIYNIYVSSQFNKCLKSPGGKTDRRIPGCNCIRAPRENCSRNI